MLFCPGLQRQQFSLILENLDGFTADSGRQAGAGRFGGGFSPGKSLFSL